jgi:hypothetical protein
MTAYLPVDPEQLVLVADRTSTSIELGEDTGADRYDADVESAFNKQGRKRKPDDRRTMWTSDMVSDCNYLNWHMNRDDDDANDDYIQGCSVEGSSRKVWQQMGEGGS